jgi:hypothetical protein
MVAYEEHDAFELMSGSHYRVMPLQGSWEAAEVQDRPQVLRSEQILVDALAKIPCLAGLELL